MTMQTTLFGSAAFQTWADGFGRWHVLVPNQSGKRKTARFAIREELSMRGDISGYQLKVDEIPSNKSGLAHFVER